MTHAELQYIHETPEQFAEVGRGAQAVVFMLTDRASYQHTTDHYKPDMEQNRSLYAEPRVLKIALGDAAIRGYVHDTIGITDPAEQKQKVDELMYHQYVTFGYVMDVTAVDPYMDAKFGYPAPVLSLSGFLHTAEDTHSTGMTYSQDYVQPVAQLFAKLDPRQDGHRLLGEKIIRQYAHFQRSLIPYGLFDTSYKLADNYGVNQSGWLRNTDFSEHSRNRPEIEESIRTREWERMPERRESTQLHPYFHDFFSLQLRTLLTRDCLEGWGSAALDPPRQRLIHKAFDHKAASIWLAHHITTKGAATHRSPR